MARLGREWNISEGQAVTTVDGDSIGRVIAVEEGHLVVEEGRLFPTNHIVPIRAVADVTNDAVRLSVTRDVVLERDWDAALPLVEAEAVTASEDVEILGTVPVGVDGEETLRVPVYQEELVPVTDEHEIGKVLLNKQVVAEERVVDVPVVEERIRITRHTVDRDPDLDDDVFTEGSLAIPIRGEEVGLTRRARVAEEVEIAKEAVQVTEQVAGTVRREEVHVEAVELPADSRDRGIDTAVDDNQMSSTSAASALRDETIESVEPVDTSATTATVRTGEPMDTADASAAGDSSSKATSGSKRSAKRSRRKKR